MFDTRQYEHYFVDVPHGYDIPSSAPLVRGRRILCFRRIRLGDVP
jgi:hypothetical protein